MPLGYLCLTLHAHLPFVRHPEYNDFLEEDWLYEAITETYLPLLRVFDRIADERVPCRVTLTITPTGGYKGTVALSCVSLPTNATCAFAQNPVALSGNNQSVTVGLQINTTTQQAAGKSPHGTLNPTLLALAFWWPGGLTGLAVFLRKRKTQPSWLLLLLFACTFALAAGLSGCGMSGTVTNQTPSTFQVMVVATGTSDAAITTQSVPLTLNVTP